MSDLDGFTPHGLCRDSVPFTDDQIADAILESLSRFPDADAYVISQIVEVSERARSGDVTRRAVGLALPILANGCGVCGKTALYRVGSSGRCREHKSVTTKELGAIWRQRKADSAIKAPTVADWALLLEGS